MDAGKGNSPDVLRSGNNSHSKGGEEGAKTSNFGTQHSGTAIDNPNPRTSTTTAPAISLPKGGGAIRSLGEKYNVDLSSGSGHYSVSLPTPKSRPHSSLKDAGISLQYESNHGNGIFGIGWSLSLDKSRISRKFDRGIPRYQDTPSEFDDEDTFIINGLEDLVRSTPEPQLATRREGYIVKTYRPRIEGSFLRIEWWINEVDTGDSFWKVVSATNEVSIYGRDRSSRIFHDGKGELPDKVFSWLLCERYDINGNSMIYIYKSEDAVGVLPELQICEQNRSEEDRNSGKYLKNIRYGNRIPNREGNTWMEFSALSLDPATWMFEIVFDYGEHAIDDPLPTDDATWRCRKDPFSTYRSGFEIRTYRLCRRILIFHHFPEHLKSQSGVLVSSFVFEYDENPFLSYLSRVTNIGYDINETSGLNISSNSLPPLTFDYSRFLGLEDKEIWRPKIFKNHEIGFPTLGANNHNSQWIDLNGEGVPGILTTNLSNNQIFYSCNISNLGKVEFQQPKRLDSQPSLSISQGVFLDISGNGSQDLVDIKTPNHKGYYEKLGSLASEDDGWGLFRPFNCFPTYPKEAYQLLDLSGDGLPDMLILEDRIFKWYSCLPGGEGYTAHPELRYTSWDEDKNPRVVFNDSHDLRIFLADISGDGMVDIVRIKRNGEVSYWPNLGYANWGGRITLGNCDWPVAQCSVDMSRIYIADVDGTGASDILYVSDDSIVLYRNQSGNSLAEPLRIPFLPTNGGRIDLVDLFGNGTICLVVTSTLDDKFAYLDFSRGKKPHLLQRIENGIGIVQNLSYSSSTKFYIQDKLNNRPWITRLPLPVHCVESVETFDSASGNRFVTRYAYHHGYYDGVEREFRGFAAVDTWDTEENTAKLSWIHGPTSHIKTWLHTGAFLEEDRIGHQLAHEYFNPTSSGDISDPSNFLKTFLPDTILPIDSKDWSTDDIRQACRSLKGSVLRREIYGEDLSLSSKASIPFLASETNFSIKKVSKTAKPVFFTHSFQTIGYNYERQLNDPRISHEVIIKIDDYGNVTKSAQIAYGCKKSDLPNLEHRGEQETNKILLLEKGYTEPVIELYSYQGPRVAEEISFEIHDADLNSSHELLEFEDLLHLSENPEIPYTTILGQNTPNGKRKIEHTITLYKRDDLSGNLPKNKIGAFGLPGEIYKLAMAQDIFAHAYENLNDSEFTPLKFLETGYTDILGDGNYWIGSGQQFYDESSNPSDELAHAKRTFFTPIRFIDPLGNITTVEYDSSILRPIKSFDALKNETSATLDYRVLKYNSITDANGNISEVKYDELGQVIATVASGIRREGDSFEKFDKYPPNEFISAFHQNPQVAAPEMLGTATARYIYDFSSNPLRTYSIIRDTHESDLQQGVASEIQVQIAYTDGLGRTIQTVSQCEPSPINEDKPDQKPGMIWIYSGWILYNNKGLEVRKFEPFYSDTNIFTRDAARGVSPYIFYDAMDRVVGQLNANKSWSKIVYGAWKTSYYDENDTIQPVPDSDDPRTDPDVGGYFKLFEDHEFSQTWYASRISNNTEFGPQEREAAQKAAIHSDTPEVSHLDALGRKFLGVSTVVAKYSDEEAIPPIQFSQRLVLDIQGNILESQDATGVPVEKNQYDFLKRTLVKDASDSGQTVMHQNCFNNLVYCWNSQKYRVRNTYDSLNRPLETFLLDQESQPVGSEKIVEKVIYGEADNDPTSRNVKLKKIKHYDQGGVVITNNYDFKGNQLSATRVYASNYRSTIDHSFEFVADIRLPSLETLTTYDAQNRTLDITSPSIEDKHSTISYSYNKTGLLKAISVSNNGETVSKPIVKTIRYNAKGQRSVIEYGNGSNTAYTYDQYTFKLRRIFTKRGQMVDFPDDCPDPPDPINPGCQIQNLRYFYDAKENITFTQDDAQQTIFFRGNKVEPSCDYTYDSIYRLIKATGREHLGQLNTNVPRPTPSGDPFSTRLDLPTNTLALGTYLEKFYYDERNNIKKTQHIGSDSRNEGWSRNYFYNEPSFLQPSASGTSTVWTGNRLSSTKVGDIEEAYKYEGRSGRGGNITSMPNLRNLNWDWKNQLQASSQQIFNDGTPETTYYVYDFSGQRIRKITDYQNPSGDSPKIKRDRIYIGKIFEKYMEYLPSEENTPSRVESSLHVSDKTKRIVVIQDFQTSNGSPDKIIRYQLSNYTESSSIELDDQAGVISYEEYYPYGATSLQATKSQLEVPKRYRFASKERDDETGLDYVGARYYASWLGRWVNPDPGGLIDGLNRYSFVRNNPACLTDPSGLQGQQLQQKNSNTQIESQQLNHGNLNLRPPSVEWYTTTKVDLNYHLKMKSREEILQDSLNQSAKEQGKAGTTNNNLIKELKLKIRNLELKPADKLGLVADVTIPPNNSVEVSVSTNDQKDAIVEGTVNLSLPKSWSLHAEGSVTINQKQITDYSAKLRLIVPISGNLSLQASGNAAKPQPGADLSLGGGLSVIFKF
ncbi:hypothetical protein H072_7990 [Dactylellina haptotyla CBS 200.50]|uniref:Insecticide toxin TcdB middle/N-terminal domain-containing protein n=1 Tax=Dactylellina haptotyla (strain CBS 200.50) TaxID=1284197 RepID=S8A592_DACHA|nr:hypothetical protein H072_7990 [Dactylellina haptotyla CBS 200.50]